MVTKENSNLSRIVEILLLTKKTTLEEASKIKNPIDSVKHVLQPIQNTLEKSVGSLRYKLMGDLALFGPSDAVLHKYLINTIAHSCDSSITVSVSLPSAEVIRSPTLREIFTEDELSLSSGIVIIDIEERAITLL